MNCTKIAAAFAVAFMALGFSACERNGEMVNGPSLTEDASIMVAAPEVVSSEIVQEASIEADFIMSAPESDRKKMPIGGIFRKLNLSTEQDSLVREMMKAQHDCTKFAMDSLRNSENAIKRAANAERKAILDSLKSGAIDRRTAGERMKQLNTRVHTAMKSNPVREWANAEVKRCRETFNTGVRAILTADQQTIWDRWITGGQTDGGKGGSTDGGKGGPIDGGKGKDGGKGGPTDGGKGKDGGKGGPKDDKGGPRDKDTVRVG